MKIWIFFKKKKWRQSNDVQEQNSKIQLQKMTLTSRVHPFSSRHQCRQEQTEVPLALTTNFLLKKEDAQPKKQCSLE